MAPNVIWACAKQFSDQFEAFSACWVWNLYVFDLIRA